MTTAIGPRAQSALDRLARIDYGRAVVDRVAVEAAINDHLARLGQPLRLFRWADDAATGYAAARAAAWDAAWDASRAAAWDAARAAARDAARDAAWDAAWDAQNIKLESMLRDVWTQTMIERQPK